MSSPLVTQFRRGGVSRDVRLTAASGALPLSPADQVELLFLLTRDRDDEVSQQAETSLHALDEASLVSVLKEEATSVDVLAFFGTRASSDEVHQALVRNASTPDETVAILVPKLTETNLEFVVVNQTRLLRHAPVLAALDANENLNSDQERASKSSSSTSSSTAPPRRPSRRGRNHKPRRNWIWARDRPNKRSPRPARPRKRQSSTAYPMIRRPPRKSRRRRRAWWPSSSP